jgi:hypothetical protein
MWSVEREIAIISAVPSIVEMEWWGIGFEPAVCKKHAEVLSSKINMLTNEAHRIAKKKFQVDNCIVLFWDLPYRTKSLGSSFCFV